MIHADDGRFGAAQLAEQPMDFFLIADPLFGVLVFGGRFTDHIGKWEGRAAFDQFADDYAAGNHREIRGKRTLAAEMSEHGEVVVDDRQKDFGGQVFAVGSG